MRRVDFTHLGLRYFGVRRILVCLEGWKGILVKHGLQILYFPLGSILETFCNYPIDSIVYWRPSYNWALFGGLVLTPMYAFFFIST